MNFSKNPQHQHHSEKFQKSSILFLQLGLVLALLVVYLALEFTTSQQKVIYHDFTLIDEPNVIIDHPIFAIEKVKDPIAQPKVKNKVPIIDPIIKPNDTELTIQVLSPLIDDEPITNVIDSIVEAPFDIDDGETLPFIRIEEAPIFPGCEDLDSLATKQCFTKKISKFVKKKFNAGLAQGLNVSGRQRIYVQFTIDKTGSVTDIIAKSPHKNLEKEAVRVVQKLPQMTPGKQRKKPVGVKYTLPIVFFIE